MDFGTFIVAEKETSLHDVCWIGGACRIAVVCASNAVPCKDVHSKAKYMYCLHCYFINLNDEIALPLLMERKF